MRVINRSDCRLGALSAWYSFASATRYRGLGAFLKDLDIGRVAIPTSAHQGHPPLLGHHELQDGLFQVRAMVFGITMGDDDGVLIAIGSILTAERKACRVEMMKALINAFLDTHRKGQLTKE